MAVGGIAREPEGDVVVLRLHGEHDLSTAPAVRRELEHAAANGGGVVVDMTETEFIDSSILGALVEGYRMLHGGAPGQGFAIAAAPGGPVTRLLDLVAVSNLVQVYPTRAEALAAVDGASS